MSIVPYRETRRRPKRRQLDQAQVVRAALALLDDVGLDELTMRRLAERLGVKAASLYRHVRDKGELLVLLGDEISGEISIAPSTGPWQEQLSEMARRVRRGLLMHRDAARLLAVTVPFGPRRLRQIESLLRILRSAGLRPRDAARAGHFLNNFVTEFVADEGRSAAFAAVPGSSRRKMFAQVRKHFKSLPRAEYPVIVELADHLADDDPDGLFEFGLEFCLRGLRSLSDGAEP
jgi:TetR/AcrR family tetracycline transcriptional repressor